MLAESLWESLKEANTFSAAISSAVNVSTRSFSQNVGDIGATFSVTAEGTNAAFTLV